MLQNISLVKADNYFEQAEHDWLTNMLLQATIVRYYFVKTQTSVASSGPPDLCIIFSNGMYLEVSPL